MVENAVAQVVQQHGVLRVGIKGEDTKSPSFTFVESIDLRDMISWQTLRPDSYDQDMLSSLERCHDRLWESLATRPGWEVIVYQSEDETGIVDIAFTFHHAYADGVASKRFHRDILRGLNSPRDTPIGLKDHVLRFDSAPELIPGMEVTVPFKVSWSYLLRTIWNEIIYKDIVPAWLKATPSANDTPWTAEKVTLEPFGSNIRLIEISETTLQSLIKACRAHNTTLTPLLHAYIASSLACRLPHDVAPTFAVTTPIDLRRCAKPGYDVWKGIACLVAAHEGTINAATVAELRVSTEKGKENGTSEATIWSTATALGMEIRTKADSLPNDDVVAMMDWVSDWNEFWTKRIGKARDSSWEVSNIGALRSSATQPQDQCTITRSIMTQGALPAGAAFSVNVSGVEGHGVCLTLTWQEGIVSSSLIDALVSDLKASIDNHAKAIPA